MAFDVTSWFMAQAEGKVSEPKRVFTIGTSDYSDRVVSWPSIKKKWDDPRAVTVSMRLMNQDKALNVFYSDPTQMRNNCVLKMGFTHPTSGDELVTLFAGTVRTVSMNKGNLTLGIRDKWKQFSELAVGDNDTPVVFSGATFFPHDLVWTIVTCYGEFSSVASTSNPDVDYQSFLDWASVFSADNVQMDGRFDGQKTTEALRSIARSTDSAIYIEEDKLVFKRFTLIDSNTSSLSAANVSDDTVMIDDGKIFNRQRVRAAYDPSSETYGIEVLDVDTVSVNSFGPRDNTIEDENVWYVNSQSALNLAQRIIFAQAGAVQMFKVDTNLTSLPRQIGETIALSNDFFSVDQNWRIMESNLSMQSGKITLSLERNRLVNPFILDSSTLDGPDVLT